MSTGSKADRARPAVASVDLGVADPIGAATAFAQTGLHARVDERARDSKPRRPARTSGGAAWTLGRHRLVCGWADDPATFARLLGDDEVDLVVTELSMRSTSERGTAGDDLPALDAAMRLAVRHAGRGAAAIVCAHVRHLRLALRAGAAMLVDLGGERALPRLPNVATVLHADATGDAAIVAAIEAGSPAGGIVLDPFAGSGATLAAAESTGRTARLVAGDAFECMAILARYVALGGVPEVARDPRQSP